MHSNTNACLPHKLWIATNIAARRAGLGGCIHTRIVSDTCVYGAGGTLSVIIRLMKYYVLKRVRSNNHKYRSEVETNVELQDLKFSMKIKIKTISYVLF